MHNGVRQPRRDSPIAGDTAMCVTAIRTQNDRKPQDRSICRTAERSRRTGVMRVHDLIRRTSGLCTTADTARDEESLLSGRIRAIL